jgi:hypothetical protein
MIFERNMPPPLQGSWVTQATAELSLLHASCWFLARFTLQYWRKRRHVPLKRRMTLNGLHDIMSQKTELFVTITAKISNLTRLTTRLSYIPMNSSPCLIKHYTMKAGVWGSGCTDPHSLDLGTSWRWVGHFTLRQLYPRGKSPRYPLDGRLGEPQSRSGKRGEEKIRDSNGTRTPTPSVVQAIANRYTDYAIPAAHIFL